MSINRWYKRLNQVAYLATACVMVFLFVSQAHATIITSTKTVQNAINYAKQTQALQQTAASWGLQSEDYRHYQWLMQHTPAGLWYKTLDPAEVLALNAKTPNEMLKYAKIQALNMHVRVTRELAFNRLYRKAYQMLYPHEKPIASNVGQQSLQTMIVHSGDRIWFFTGLKTPLGKFAAEDLLKVIQKVPHTILDIYFVGSNVNKVTITHWAMSVGITPAMVNRIVTLNTGNSRFKTMTQGKHVHLPTVGVVHNNHFQPITLNSII